MHSTGETMFAGSADSVRALLNAVRFGFQPVVNVRTGAIVAAEVLSRPASGNVGSLFRAAARQRRLADLDVALVTSALGVAAEHEAHVPLHVNVFAGTIVESTEQVLALRDHVRATGRHEADITLEIGPPFTRLDTDRFLAAAQQLREAGFRLALDDMGSGDVPLKVITDLVPDLIKVDSSVVAGVPDDPHRVATLEALAHLCRSIDARLHAVGVSSERQLTALRHNGVRMVQGNLLGPAARRPPATRTVPGVAAEVTDPGSTQVRTLAAGPRVSEFLVPAVTLSHAVLADEVREVFAQQPEVSGVVLVDEHNAPQWTVERNRFLLAVTGPYGHALHAKRPASRLADEPRVVTTATTAMEALGLVTESSQNRMYDDAVVVDEDGRCLGVIQAGDLIRGMADLKVEQAATLNPLTRLPGSDAVARDVARRIAAGEVFTVSWLDVDGFKAVNDEVGFSAGDELIRALGRALTDAATAFDSVAVGHVGGDDFLLVADVDDVVALSERVLDPPRRIGDVEVGLSLATVVCTPSTVTSYEQASQRLAPLKHEAKSLSGSSWVLSRPGSEQVNVLRGTPKNGSEVPRQSNKRSVDESFAGALRRTVRAAESGSDPGSAEDP
ncbi:EAL domain-containing protein [Bounagaea algeriensis]